MLNSSTVASPGWDVSPSLVTFPPPLGGGYCHTWPIRVCAAQRGRDFEAPDLERVSISEAFSRMGYHISNARKLQFCKQPYEIRTYCF